MIAKKLMSVWSDPEFLSRLSRWVPYIFLLMGFAVAASGLWIQTVVENRAEDLRKQTPPSLDAYLATSSETGDLRVVFDAKNTAPFYARWFIVTKEDRLISGIMTGDETIHPTKDRTRFIYEARSATES